MGPHVAYFSDQRFFRAGDAWYTTASFPLDFIARHLDVASWTFWGRLDETDDPSRLFPLVPPPALAGKVFFEGPRGQRTGPLGYAHAALFAQSDLRRVVRRSDVVWLKQPTVFSLFAYPHCRSSQVVVSQQVGDAAAGLLLTYPRYAALRHAGVRACRWIAARATVASFVSHDLAARYGGERRDLVVANESRVTAQMVLSAPEPRAQGPLEVVFVGRLAPEKCVDDLLEAVARVPEARLTIVGDGPKRGALEARSYELGLVGRVAWCGYVPWGPRLLEILRRSSVLALPSATEGLPLVIVEAMSQGVPVLATRVGGIPELVEEGRSGLLVDVHRPDQLAAALEILARDSQRWLAMARAALGTARHNTLEVQTGRLLERIIEASGSSRPRPFTVVPTSPPR
jgi:glycosyltransferase involved in cell wall biosynthesis